MKTSDKDDQLSIICIGLEEDEIIQTISTFSIFDNVLHAVYIVSPTKVNLPSFKYNFNIYHICDDNRGIYEAMNLGLQAIDTRAFMIVNAGDYLQEEVSYKSDDIITDSLILFISKRNLFWKIYFRLKLFKLISKENFAMFTIRLGFMPCSHQNIIYPVLSKSHPFPHSYRYSADYVHLYEEIFNFKRPLKIINGSIGQTSPGGVSDTQRLSVIIQRLQFFHSLGRLSVAYIALSVYLFLIILSKLLYQLKNLH